MFTPTSDLITKLKWRYATKKMDPSKVVPADIGTDSGKHSFDGHVQRLATL